MWVADFCAEGSSPWAGNCMGVFSTACPWKASVGDVIPVGVSTKCRHTVGNERGARFCCLAPLSSPVDAGIEQKVIPRESYAYQTELLPLILIIFFFMTPVDKDKARCQISGLLRYLFPRRKHFKCFWTLTFMKS